jgi:hypothetical protein
VTGKRINPSVLLKDKGRKIYFSFSAARKTCAAAPQKYGAKIAKVLAENETENYSLLKGWPESAFLKRRSDRTHPCLCETQHSCGCPSDRLFFHFPTSNLMSNPEGERGDALLFLIDHITP